MTGETVADARPLALAVPPAFIETLVETVAAVVLARIEDRPRYMDTGQVADYLAVPKKRVDNLCSQSRIPFRKDGGRRIFIKREIDEWVRQLDGPTVSTALAASR